MSARIVFWTCLFLGWCHPAWAQGRRGDLSDFSRNSPATLSAFRPVVANVRHASVRILVAGKPVAMGTIVGPDGWILSKASEIKGIPVCRLSDGRELEARIVGINESFDVAMLKVEATNLGTVTWLASRETQPGDWVASAGPASEPLAVGVISTPARQPRLGGFLGVSLESGKDGVRIMRVDRATPAERAGLKANDVILKVDGNPVTEVESCIDLVQKHRPGENVALRYRRGEEEKETTATLGKAPVDPKSRGEMQNRMGTTPSERRDGFPVILQHDTILRAQDCGGPLVNLDGQTVGINIARWGRTDTYALPAEAIQPILADLMSGKMAPAAGAPATLTPAERAKQTAEAVKRAESQASEAQKKLLEARSALAEAEKAVEAEKKEAEKREAEKKAAEKKDAEKKPSEKKSDMEP